MFHYQENIQDSNGVAQKNWSIDLCSASNDPVTAPAVTIYSDRAATLPIAGNKVKANTKGFVGFYVPTGLYTRRYYNSANVYQYAVLDTDMIGDVGDVLENLANIMTGGALTSGLWIKLPAIYAILVGGAGSITIDSRTRDGVITTGVASYTAAGNSTIYPYFTDAYQVRATLTGTATAEII